MNLLKKIFGSKTQQNPHTPDERTKLIQETTEKLWKLIEDSLTYYNSIACQCAFPRFQQYTKIDCTDTHNSFYMSETEGFIYKSRDLFQIIDAEKGQECTDAIYKCKKCGSTFDFGWSDFSIHVSRSFLKPKQITVEQIGADPIQPIPFVVGLFGHSLPDRALFQKMELDQFAKYIMELKKS